MILKKLIKLFILFLSLTLVSPIHGEQNVTDKLRTFDDQILPGSASQQDEYAGKYRPKPAAKPAKPSAKKAFNKAARKKPSSKKAFNNAARKKPSSKKAFNNAARKKASSKNSRGYKKPPHKSLAKRRSINSKSALKNAFRKASSGRPGGLAATFNKRALTKKPPKISAKRRVKPKSSIKKAFNKKARYDKFSRRIKNGKKAPSYLAKKFNNKSGKSYLRTKFNNKSGKSYLRTKFMHASKNNLPTGDKIKFDKRNLTKSMKERGWTKQGIRELTKTKPTGTSVDRRNKGHDPATVYGTRERHVVVNDRTGQVVQISGKRKDGTPWRPNKNIKWH